MNAPDQNPSLVDRVAVSVTVLNHLVPSRASVVSDISWLLTRRLSVKVLSYASVTLLYCHCHPSSSIVIILIIVVIQSHSTATSLYRRRHRSVGKSKVWIPVWDPIFVQFIMLFLMFWICTPL